MDFIVIFTLLILGSIFVQIIRGSGWSVIGNIGEAKVRKTLVRYCANRDAHILNNITLRLKYYSTTQIDHILITTRGVFVIETKNYAGWIFANAKSKLWAQILFKEKNQFQNPIFQNYKHIKAVQKTLDFFQ